MIVNNTVQQPDNYGHTIQSNRLQPNSFAALSADSLAYFFSLSLGKAMTESPLFDDVRLCDDTLRHDSLFLFKQPLQMNDVAALCDEYEVDALISLDKLLFYSSILLSHDQNAVNWVFFKIFITGELRAVCPGYRLSYTVPFVDSLSRYFSIIDYKDEFGIITYISFEDIRESMRYLAETTGYNLRVHFTPFWTDDKRWLYTSVLSDWKRATSYALADRWEAAADEWLPLFAKEKRWKHKARLASNLALYYEVTGNFSKAIEFAERAHTILKAHRPVDDIYREKQHDYLEILKKRAEDDHILTEQLRENN